MLRIYSCGSCGHYHEAGYRDDCRNDAARFESGEDYAERKGLDPAAVEEVEVDSDYLEYLRHATTENGGHIHDLNKWIFDLADGDEEIIWALHNEADSLGITGRESVDEEGGEC